MSYWEKRNGVLYHGSSDVPVNAAAYGWTPAPPPAVEPAPSPAAAGLPLEDFTEAEAERLARMEAAEPAPESWSPLYEELSAEILTDMREIGYTGSWVHSAVRVLMRRERAATALAAMQPTAAVPDPRFRDQLAEWLREYGVGRSTAPRLADHLLPLVAAEVEARVRAALAPVSHDADGGERR